MSRRLALLLTCAVSCTPDDGHLLDNMYGLTVCAKGPVVEGVDVSAYQPNTDWMKVKASGRGFAIVKATEHTSFVNKYFKQDWAGLKAAGMLRGPYHFFRANIDPVAQADFFVQTVGPLADGDLPYVCDMETTDGQTGATVAARALAFLARIEQTTGRTPMVYTSPSFFNGTLGNPAGFEKYHLWIAHWQTMCPNVPGRWTNWPFWQYSSTGAVPGIQGNVDLDRFNGSLAELMAFAGVKQPLKALPHVNGNEALSVVNWPDQHVEIFARSTKGELLRASTSGGNDVWSMPALLDGNARCGFATAFWGSPWLYPEVWGPLGNGRAGHLWWANNQWNGWQDFGAQPADLAHFSTLVRADGRSDVLALGKDGAIWRRFWDLQQKDWSPWQSLGGKLATGAASILWQDGHAELFASDDKGAAWHDFTDLNGAFSGWQSLGGALASRPIPVRWPDGHVELFARGRDSHLQHAFWNGMKWTAFAALDAQLILDGEPSAIMNPKGGGGSEGAEVFARDAQGRVVHAWWTGNAWSAFAPLGNEVAASDPLAWVRGDGRAEVFMVDPQGRLLRALRDGNGMWSGWAKIGDNISPCAPPPPPPLDAGTDAAPRDGGVDLALVDLAPVDLAVAVDRGAADRLETRDGEEGADLAPRPELKGGCGCRVGGAPRPVSWAFAFALLLAAFLASRRRQQLN